MLAKRVIPVLLCKGYNLVKGKQFAADRVIGNVMQAVEVFNLRWADELVVLDVEARALGRCIPVSFVEEIAAKNLVPLTVGGGIDSKHQAKELIQHGADKVVIGNTFRTWLDVIEVIADAMGRQAVVVCINYVDPVRAVRESKEAEKSGAGEIILQCIERDGMMQGYDLDTAFHVASSVDIPVVLSCGAGTYEHLYEGIRLADAVAVGAMWAFTDSTPKEAKKYLSEKGVCVRV